MVTNNVRKAEEKDFDPILRIQDFWIQKGRSDQVSEREEGFLVYPLSKDDLSLYSQDPNHRLYVYQDNGSLGGYLAAHIKDGLIDGTNISSRHCYVKHVAKRDDKASPRIPIALERRLFEDLTQEGVDSVIGEIALDPENTRSLKFHTSQGFKKVGEKKDGRGILWGVFCKTLGVGK